MMSVMMTLDTTEAQAEMEKYHNAHKGSEMSNNDYSCSGADGVGKEFQAVTASQAPRMMSMMSSADRLTATPAFLSKADPKALSAYRIAKNKRTPAKATAPAGTGKKKMAPPFGAKATPAGK